MSALLLTGPAVALIGIVAVFFVMRHKSVEKRSMYSSRRSQIEHKVRAARQRTMAPLKRDEKASRAGEDEGASSTAATLRYEAPAYAGPPVAPPPLNPSHLAPAQPAWDIGPTAPAPSPPPLIPPAPAYEPPPAAPPPAEPPPSETPQAQQVWTPAPEAPEPAPRERAPAQTAAAAPTGGGASWSVVGETKGAPEPELAPAAKKKKSKDEARTGAWQLASGEVAGEEADDGPKKPSTALAIAQYAALVLGLCLVLIGVVVMVANQHGT